MREILVDWTTPSGGGKISVFYFDEAAAVTTQRADLGTMLGAIDAHLYSTVTWRVRTDGRLVDESTGAMTGVWSAAAAQAGTGSESSQPVPDASQVLLRWGTSEILGGRFVRGRTFIPGLAVENIIGGNVAEVPLGVINTAASAFATADNGFGVWHRPVAGSGGTLAPVGTGSCWAELAVLRRRRG